MKRGVDISLFVELRISVVIRGLLIFSYLFYVWAGSTIFLGGLFWFGLGFFLSFSFLLFSFSFWKTGSDFFAIVLLFSPGYILMIDDFPCLG